MAIRNGIDVVTEASMESFPASDPPGWIRSVAAPSESTTCPSEAELRFGSTPRRFPMRAIIGGVVLVAALVTAGVVLYRRRA